MNVSYRYALQSLILFVRGCLYEAVSLNGRIYTGQLMGKKAGGSDRGLI